MCCVYELGCSSCFILHSRDTPGIMSCFFCGCENVIVCVDCKISACPQHMPLHNKGGSCMPWRVATVEGAGRGLFASRNISAGEVVLKDWPVVEGPLPDGGDGVCVVCLEDGDVARCSLCTLPLCRSRACRSQHKKECDVLAEKDDIGEVSRDNMYTIVAVMRLLWEMERDPSMRSLLEPLMDHKEQFRNDENKKQVIKFLVRRNHEEELILRAIGILQTNGVTSHSAGGVARGHGLYPVFSITNHSCVANTRHGVKDDAFCLVATVDIAKDQEITTSYKSSSLGSIVRRPPFRQLWNFDCTCPRCSDPTELGTYASALKCKGCSGHYLPVQCLDYSSEWRCDKCNKTITADQAMDRTEVAQKICGTGRGSIDDLEKTLYELLEHVHSRHYLAMQIKRMLMLMYGNCASHRLDSMSKKDIKRKADLCKEYLTIFNILEPGLTKWKGRVCEELARALVKLQGKSDVEVLRLVGEAGKCRRLDSQQEQSAFNMRIATLMNG